MCRNNIIVVADCAGAISRDLAGHLSENFSPQLRPQRNETERATHFTAIARRDDRPDVGDR